ncbi:MAG: hypothetical protein R3Y64_00880 [Peptostreptococcaceae bacterium]
MSYFLDTYTKSVIYSQKHDDLASICRQRKLKYPAIYKEENDNKLAVVNISYPSTTEMIADYLSKDAEYITIYHKKLNRKILILCHEGRYFHEFDKDQLFLVVGILLKDNLKKVCYDLEDFLKFNEETNEYRFIEYTE